MVVETSENVETWFASFEANGECRIAVDEHLVASSEVEHSVRADGLRLLGLVQVIEVNQCVR